MTPLQKLVWPATTVAYLQEGSALLAGPVVRIADAIGWKTPAQLLEAYGVSAEGVESVDVLRFESAPVDRLSVPDERSRTSAAGYPTGFLRGAGGIVPVWDIAVTEVPQGAELWRIHADGKQELISAYAGPAFGWRSTGVFAPPSLVVGPRAEWQGAEYFASWVNAEHIELVVQGDTAPDGFEQTRPQVFRRVVPVADCSRIFANSFSAVWNDSVHCDIVQISEEQAAVLMNVDASQAAALGAIALEPGVYWKLVPRAELTQVEGATTEVAPNASSERSV